MKDRQHKDIDSEQAVIGAVLLDSSSFTDVSFLLQPHDFSVPYNVHCFRAMLDIHLKGGVIDKLTLSNRLRELGIDSISDDYLNELMASCEHPENISDYAKIVRDKSAKRLAIKKISKALKNLIDEDEDIASILTDLNDSTNRIFLSASSVKYRKVNEIIMDCIQRLDDKRKPDYKDVSIIPSGLVELDKFIKGHRLGCLDVVAARPSMGKTSLALSTLLNVAGRLMIPSMLISLEMSESQLGDKLLAMRTGIDFSKIEEPKKLKQADFDVLVQKISKLEQLNLHIDDHSYTPTDIVASVRSGAKDGIKFFVIDHLHLINMGNGALPRHQQIGKVTKTLAALCKELDIHITVLAQLNRDIERRDKHYPTLADLKDSSDIEMAASTVIFIHREDYYDSDVPIGDATLIIAKNRYGERNRHAEVAFVPRLHLFCNRK